MGTNNQEATFLAQDDVLLCIQGLFKMVTLLKQPWPKVTDMQRQMGG